MIEKNNKKGNKGDKRIYYSCLGSEKSLEEIKNEKKENEKALNELIESSKNNDNFCGVAFVTFNTIKEQEDYLNKNKKQSCCFPCKHKENKDSLNSYKRKIIFERAPEPEDIIFENFNINIKDKFKNTKFDCDSFIRSIFLLITFVISIILYYYQSKIDKSSSKSNILYVFSFILTIASALNDFILEIVVEKITKFMKYYTFTHFHSNYSILLTCFLFVNSCLIPALFEIHYKTDEHEILTNNLLTKFLFNSFISPIMWTINFKFVYKKFKQCIIEQKDKIDYNQKELNELYELQSMNVPMKYSYIIKTLSMTFFFAPIFPLGFGISLIGFIFGYHLEKFNFSKMYKKPEKLDKQIAEYYIIYFFIIFYVYILGNYFFLSGVLDIWTTISLDFFFVLLFIPFNRFFNIDFFKFKESEVHKKTYDEMYLDFTIDYERANPMTRVEGEMRYLDKLEEKNKIDKKEKEKRQKKLKEENQMKFYLNQRRTGKIINSKDLNNVLNIDNDEQKKIKDKDIFCNIEPTIENYKKGKQIFKKKTFNKRKKSSKINLKK